MCANFCVLCSEGDHALCYTKFEIAKHDSQACSNNTNKQEITREKIMQLLTHYINVLSGVDNSVSEIKLSICPVLL